MANQKKMPASMQMCEKENKQTMQKRNYINNKKLQIKCS